ncbi:MAG: acyl-CoA dehydrogenase family protein [Achromobacter sp.]|jgi:alkylation response protein AidB-like acyl-CoA dehydrogenase|uniref:acyl-CoA dehydrogenase family protein n=1 Tax=unclassified Achromobacter TaxID=2626865 RepID=UPI0006F5164D|nr:acyl-CoA dehydrogenase family protein [Achromobacter sp. Root565]KRA02034.1 pimeloyl-CoA dehydrogenase large subunit [Achromobacter sp. Root565]
MDLEFTPEEVAFRDEVRAFLDAKLPRRLADKVGEGKLLTRDDMAEWHAILNAQGWLATHWPEEYGGTGWTAAQKYLFDNECALANAPRIVPFGLSMLGPVLIKYGSEAQRRYWLPRILDGSDWWCQGYSEPGAGSDLASLKTTAVRDGDSYVVNGQKTWTTLGQYANMIFCLVRTSQEGRRQEGISFLLIDMNSPGIEVRPIITLDGEHEVNEVFFSDVRVPVENLVGEENRGWTCAKYLLTYERTNIAGVGQSTAALERLKAVAARQKRHGRPLTEDPDFAARLARVEIELANMRTTNLRVVAAVAGGGAPGAESSMLKIRGTQIRQEISALNRRAMGPYARPFVPEALHDGYDAPPIGPDGANSAAAQYFNNRKLSIFGGSNEIQKNIISKMILGL